MARVLLDVIVAILFWILLAVPVTVVGTVTGRAGWLPVSPWWMWALAPGLVFVFVVTLLTTAFVLRVCLPGLRPGRYPFPRHPQSITWLLHMALQRMMYLPQWRLFILAFSTLRWALFRALGARVAFNVDTSSDVMLMDLPLLDLGAGTMIGSDCSVSGHLIEHGELQLGRVSLGGGTQVSSGVVIGPGVTIGEHATIGPDCRLAGDNVVGAYAYLGVACYVSPGVSIGANAVLGHQVGLAPGVTIGEGAVVDTGVRVPRNTAVAAGTHYPPEPGD